jgi:hypothetical protein
MTVAGDKHARAERAGAKRTPQRAYECDVLLGDAAHLACQSKWSSYLTVGVSVVSE